MEVLNKKRERFPLELQPWIAIFMVTVISIIAIVILCFTSPISQDPSYHHFADNRTKLGISNFWNVISNVGFLLVGMLGSFQVIKGRCMVLVRELRAGYLIFFLGISLVAIGSAQYHLHPSNLTLIWDRAPMTIAFMALLAISFAEYLSTNLGKFALWPLLILGQFSVFYWYWGELQNRGDLRLYGMVQFIPVVILPLLLLFGKRKFDQQWSYWLLLSFYMLGKVAEHYDADIFELTRHLFGGHALKHIFICLGLLGLLRCFETRKMCGNK